jgi:hypothetical protein
MRRTTAVIVALIAASLAALPLADAQPKKSKRGRKRPAVEQPEARRDTPPPQPTATGADQRRPSGGRGSKTQVLDFTGLELGGRMRTPQLLYFLDRVDEELERAALEQRSFIPAMTRSIDEGPL